MNLLQLFLGFLLALIVSALAYKVRALTVSGAAAAAVVGTVVFGLGGLPWAILLLAFFVTSSLLSHLPVRNKGKVEEKNAKGSQRDAAQVLANGGVASLSVLALLAFDQSFFQLNAATSFSQALTQAFSLQKIGQPLLFLVYAASLAAATADTWATELGGLSRRPPFLITTGKQVEPGTSGAVSLPGSLAGMGGAVLMGLLAAWLVEIGAGNQPAGILPPQPVGFLLSFLAVAAGGLAGSWFDTLLGATLQVVYNCPLCLKETERHPRHTCGVETVYKRGWRWLNNDRVNAACTAFGSLAAIAILRIH